MLWDDGLMKWARPASIGISTLICGFAMVWYVLVWVYGGELRTQLLLNVVYLCGLSSLLLVLRFLKIRPAIWLCSGLTKWFAFWLLLGLFLPIPLFLLDRFQPYLLGESVLFTLWPSCAIFMSLEVTWKWFPLIMTISMAINAGIYAVIGGLVWFLAKRLSLQRAASGRPSS